MQEYLIGIGQAIGIVPIKKEIIGIIDLGECSRTLDYKSFGVWQMMCQYIECDKFNEEYSKLNCGDEVKTYLDKFIKEEILIKISLENDIEDTFNLIKNLKLNRQGLGLGVNLDNVAKFTVIGNEAIELEALDFSIWSSANYQQTIEEIYINLESRMDKIVFITSLLRLYNGKLVYFRM